METLLFLAHRLPYPPDKGDKIRSCNWFRHLAQRYHILLGTFIDDPVDWQHLDAVKALCKEVHVEPISPHRKKVLSAVALVTGEAMTLPYFYSSSLDRWVREVVRRDGVQRAFAYSSPMAQYLVDLPEVNSVIDFVDMDSVKWEQYAQRRSWPLSLIFRREARRLLRFEKSIASQVAASLFVTPEEARVLADAAPEHAGRIVAIENGVDSEYFSPEHESASPFSADEHAIVFTGTMDYWPNVDAVEWFAQQVLPRIREHDHRARFHIVGMNPSSAVRALGSDEAVSVTGRVPDMRPYLKHSRAVVAPIRVAQGIQNKVLEAMAMARPVVVTSASAAVLSVRPGMELEVADEPSEFAAKVLAVMDPSRGGGMGRLARERVLSDYAWPSRFRRLDELFAGADRMCSARPHATSAVRILVNSASAQ